MGRWLSEDPANEFGFRYSQREQIEEDHEVEDRQLYGFVHNNAVCQVDIDGCWPWDPEPPAQNLADPPDVFKGYGLVTNGNTYSFTQQPCEACNRDDVSQGAWFKYDLAYGYTGLIVKTPTTSTTLVGTRNILSINWAWATCERSRRTGESGFLSAAADTQPDWGKLGRFGGYNVVFYAIFKYCGKDGKAHLDLKRAPNFLIGYKWTSPSVSLEWNEQ